MSKLIVTLLLLGVSGLKAQPAPETHEFNGAVDGQHMMSFTPFCAMVAYNNVNPGIGFEYEYIFDRKANIGLRIPFTLGYEGPEQGITYYSGSSYKHTTVYAAPGLRFHAVIGRDRTTEFATGPAIILGNMHFRPSENYYGGAIVGEPFNYGLTGIMADNSINFYRNHFAFGFDVRVGSLIDVHESTRFFLHIGMHFGGKF